MAIPEAVPPSPNLHAYETIVPPGSKEPEPLKVSVLSVWVNWSGPAFATGASDPASVDVVDVVPVNVVVVNVVVVNVPNVVAPTVLARRNTGTVRCHHRFTPIRDLRAGGRRSQEARHRYVVELHKRPAFWPVHSMTRVHNNVRRPQQTP